MDQNGQIRSDQKSLNGKNKPIEMCQNSPTNAEPKG